ncbi:DNA mismatch endonuclease Vsr [Pseudomonas frederiksbergensis]|nr:DNA mismatch endonuclease Vsr [Pseudomonas frederiksbergensis]
MDILTPIQRSNCMQRIKSKNTKPELIVRSMCHRLGYRFRLGRKDLPGTPDLVFPRLKLCLFVHGCFWHRHEGCKYAYSPKTRVDFWESKFARNVIRDNKVMNALKASGWNTGVVWECETKNAAFLEKKLIEILRFHS